MDGSVWQARWRPRGWRQKRFCRAADGPSCRAPCSTISSQPCKVALPLPLPAVQMKSICARARNSYSKEQLRKDFR